MSDRQTIHGVPITDPQIAAWAIAAAAGYDVEELKRRMRARPGPNSSAEADQ